MIFCRVYDSRLMESCVSYQQGDGFSIFAVLNLGEPPRKLASDKKKSYHCHFSLPLPSQVVVFGLGDWGRIPKNSKINVDVWLDTELPPKRIGFLSSEKRCLCWEGKWDETFLSDSFELHSQDRMAKLTVVIEDNPFSFTDEEKENYHNKVSPPSAWQQTKDTSSDSAITPQQKTNNKTSGKLKQQKLSFSLKSKNENIEGSRDETEVKKHTSLLSTHPSNLNVAKKKRRTSLESPSLKRQKGPAKDRTITNSSPATRSSPLSQLPTPPDTPCMPSSSDSPDVPSGRWGHAFAMIDDDRAVMVGGQGTKQMMVRDSLCILNTKSNTWFMKEKESGAERRMGHTITYDPARHQLYVYGGSKNKRWFSDIHILDTQTWKWSEVKAVGKAPTRAYHTAALFCGELFVFGGNFPNPHPQPDGCSNELFVFDPEKHSWYTPLVTGDIPEARSGHSASLLDEKLVIFGGWDAPKCFNDIHIVDLALMEFTCPKVTGTPPKARSWHTSTTLPKRKVFIHGGFDGVQVLGDAFLFELDTLTWTSVQTPPSLSPRVGHASLHLHDAGDKNSEYVEKQIVVFGGGDNRGGYFNDLVRVKINVKSI